MSNEIRNRTELLTRLDALWSKINRELDRIHAEVLVLLLSQGRATGQRTRLDRGRK